MPSPSDLAGEQGAVIDMQAWERERMERAAEKLVANFGGIDVVASMLLPSNIAQLRNKSGDVLATAILDHDQRSSTEGR